MATSTGSPCGACKFLRRKCASDCVFAPYFCSDQGSARFAAIHKVFGASNVSKLLMRVPVSERGETVVTIAYEAQARLQDPVYGCVGHVFALQQQVAYLQGQIMQFKTKMAQSLQLVESSNRNIENINHYQQQQILYDQYWQTGNNIDDHDIGGIHDQSNFRKSESYDHETNCNINSLSSGHDQSISTDDSLMESLDGIYEIQSNMSDCDYHERNFSFQSCPNMGELQALAIRMMRN